jgi:alpha-L-fucosidase
MFAMTEPDRPRRRIARTHVKTQFLRLCKAVTVCLLARLLATADACGSAPPGDPPATDQKSLRSWRDAKFGLFIHWGPVSLKGTEIGWSRGDQVPSDEYDQLYRQFNPTNFDADAWAGIAKEAGMRYVVLTSKHHDGFCLWATRLTNYNIMKTPFGRDVVKELATACRQRDLVFGTYHSICDWRHPDYPLGSPGGTTKKPNANMDRYQEYLESQVAELIRSYGPLGVMWFDGEWEAPWTSERGMDLYRLCRSLQPSILVNNRVGKGRAGMEGTTATGAFAGDFDTPEQRIGNYQTNRAWESCMTICEQWSWKPNDRLKSFNDCLHALVRTVGGDGNLLLNVGPMPDGRIEPRQVERLKEIGRWLKKNGKSIYGTRGGPFTPGPWGASTRRGNTVYVHVLDWGGREDLALPAVDRRIRSAALLGGGKVPVERTPDGIRLRVPPEKRDAVDTIVVLKLGLNIPLKM